MIFACCKHSLQVDMYCNLHFKGVADHLQELLWNQRYAAQYEHCAKLGVSQSAGRSRS